MVFSEPGSLDFQAKKSGIQPQFVLVNKFLNRKIRSQKIIFPRKRLPDAAQTSRDLPWALFDIADSAVATRESVNLTFMAQTAM